MRLRSALGTGVTRRVVGLFVACALLPVALAIGISYSHVQDALVTQRVGQLRDAAGSYATSLSERLTLADVLAHSVADNADDPRALQRKHAFSEYFRTAVVIDSAGPRTVYGRPSRLPDLKEIGGSDAHLAAGKTVLAVVRPTDDQPPGIWLVRSAASSAANPRSLALELNPRYLWGTSDELPFQTDICALDEQGETLYCSQPIPAATRTSLVSERKGKLAWDMDGARQLSGFLELFLKGKFAASPWTIVATQPEEYALGAVQSVRRLVVPVVVLGLLVAALLGMVQVRRTLGPLKELTDATGRIAARQFDARVPAVRDDEFGALARAFNSMSVRLGRQFHALEANAEIDAVILSNVDMAQVAGIVLRRMGQVVQADRRALLLADTAREGVYQVHAADAEKSPDGRSIVLAEADAQRLRAAGGGVRVFGGQSPIASLADIGSRHVHAVPVTIGTELAGALVLGYDEDRAPDEEEVAHLRELADRIAVALATARRDLELHRRAHYDSLTQLPNRLLGLEELDRAVAAAARRESMLAVLFVDLDGFSAVNDSLGHASGDQLLVQAAERLRQAVRKSDIVSRLGGDEFAIVLPEIREASEAALVAAHVIEALSRPFDIRPTTAFVSASVGIALFPNDGATGEDLLRQADLAMYGAKEKGRGQSAFFEASMNAEVQRRLTLERELRQALERDEFKLYFQPQLDVTSGRIVGAEALLRWIHPERGLVPPGQFIPFAERSPLIEDIGRWALKAACAQLVAWRADGLPIDHVSVNVAPRQFQNPGFAHAVADTLRAFALPPGALRLEITESAVIGHEEAVEMNLAALNTLGTALELDDFGTGYSSLAYLQRLPVATVKLDIALIRTIESNTNNRAVVRAAIDMVHALGKTVVAEGVETAGQLDILASLGCDTIQGYYLSPPLPAVKFAQLTRDRAGETRAAA